MKKFKYKVRCYCQWCSLAVQVLFSWSVTLNVVGCLYMRTSGTIVYEIYQEVILTQGFCHFCTDSGEHFLDKRADIILSLKKKHRKLAI